MFQMHSHKRPASGRAGRLRRIAFGLALAVISVPWMLGGVQVQTHWTGQPMFSWGLVGGGGLCILLALIPESWIAKTATPRSKAERHRPGRWV